MFYERLSKIYQDKPFLSTEFPFEEYYPLFKRFVLEEVERNTKYINPYRFSYNYGIAPKRSLRLFLVLSDHDESFLEKYFFYECECGESVILPYEQIYEFTCPNCEESITDSDESYDYLKYIKILFKLSNSIRQGVLSDLKAQSPSDYKGRKGTDSEGDEQAVVTLGEAFEVNKLKDEPTASKDLDKLESRVFRALTYRLN
ncbi:hypothetical protein [Paenibacillus oleatilyticus]|uniref:Uncharacterized protein n=1 Tax=Paenibacillus oleatilyticus TaxID=2594886 RepID=A0ABV4UZZ7_9BACL